MISPPPCSIAASGEIAGYTTLRSRFDAARRAAKVSFQFRDIRAKSAKDLENLTHAQKLLGHKTRAMTEHYTRNRKCDSVSPLGGSVKRKLSS